MGTMERCTSPLHTLPLTMSIPAPTGRHWLRVRRTLRMHVHKQNWPQLCLRIRVWSMIYVVDSPRNHGQRMSTSKLQCRSQDQMILGFAAAGSLYYTHDMPSIAYAYKHLSSVSTNTTPLQGDPGLDTVANSCVHSHVLSHPQPWGREKKVTLYEYMFLYLMCMTSWYNYL